MFINFFIYLFWFSFGFTDSFYLSPCYHKLFSNLYFFGGDTASRIGRELATEQRSQRNDRDKFLTASRAVYGLVKQEFGALCKKFNFPNSIAADNISPHQQVIRIRKKIGIASVLGDFISHAIVSDENDFPDENSDNLDNARQFLQKYIISLNALLSKKFHSKKVDRFGFNRLLSLDSSVPLVSADIDAMMVMIVDRMVAGLPPVPLERPDEHEEMEEFQDWIIAHKLIQDMGLDQHLDPVSKIPIDIIFKSGKEDIDDVKFFPDSVKDSMNCLFKAWANFPIQHKEVGSMMSSPVVLSNPVQIPPPAGHPIRDYPESASLDLMVDIMEPPKHSTGVRFLYSSTLSGFERSRGCSQTIADFLDVVKIFLNTALIGDLKCSIALSSQPLILMLLAFYLGRKRQGSLSNSQLYSDLTTVYFQQVDLPSNDPLCLSEIIRSRHGQICARHVQYLRRNLVIEVLDAIVCRIIPDLSINPFSFFDSNLAVAHFRTCETLLGEVSDLFRKFVGKFNEDFRTLPKNSGIEPSLWGLIPHLLFGDSQSIPTDLELDHCATEIDTSLKIRKGVSSRLKSDDCFMVENSYPFEFGDNMDLFEDFEQVKSKLPLCFRETEEKLELTVPTPLAWELLVRHTRERGDSTNDFLSAWMVAGARKKIDVELINKLVPGHSFVFDPRWFTAARKVMFHLFLHSGSMKANLFNTITGLKDLHEIMDKNFRIWQELPKWLQTRLKKLAPLFESLKPILTLANHVRKVAKYWHTIFHNHNGLLTNPKRSWEAQIQIVKSSLQTKKFSTFSTQEEVRLLKNSKKLSGSDLLKTGMYYLRSVSIHADKLWDSVVQKYHAGEFRDGHLMMEAYSISMIAFLYHTTVTTGLRSQNLSETKSINSSTLWTPATVLKHMDPNSFDIDLESILSKNHRIQRLRNIALPLESLFEIEKTGFCSVQKFAIRLYVLQKLLFCAGLQVSQKLFSLNNNALFHWDRTKLKSRDWRREKPRTVTDSSWTSFGAFIFKNFIPQTLGLKPITITVLRKLLVSVQMGAGVSATKRLTGHKSDNSLLHYVLAVPWLDQLLKDLPPADRPFLAKAILNFEITVNLKSGEPLSHSEMLERFSLEKCRVLIEDNKISKSEGILKQRGTLEFVFWSALHKARLDKFKLNSFHFNKVFKEAIETVNADPAQDNVSQAAVSNKSTVAILRDGRRRPLPVRPQKMGVRQHQVEAVPQQAQKGNGGF